MGINSQQGHHTSALQSQKAVTAYFSSKHLLPFGLRGAPQSVSRLTAAESACARGIASLHATSSHRS